MASRTSPIKPCESVAAPSGGNIEGYAKPPAEEHASTIWRYSLVGQQQLDTPEDAQSKDGPFKRRRVGRSTDS